MTRAPDPPQSWHTTTPQIVRSPTYNDQQEIADLTLGELRTLRLALKRAKTILGNMALENEGAIFDRWHISHEPLRADAKSALPVIDDALRICDFAD